MFLTKCLTLVAVCGLAAFGQTTTNPTRTQDFPPFGLGSTETARVNLTNIATASSSGAAASCTGSVGFVNAGGATIGSATSFTIASGQTFSASLPFNSSGLTAPRGEIRVVVQVTRSTTTPAPCSLLTSIQTFDTSSGVTHLYMSGADGFGFAGGPGPRGN